MVTLRGVLLRGVLLRGILAIRLLFLILGRWRVGSLRLVGRLSRRIRAGGLRGVLALLVLILRGILCDRLTSRLRLERSLLLSLIILLRLHGDGLGGGSLVVKQESAFLASLEEIVQSPGKGCNEEKPDQSTKAGDGSKLITTALEQDDIALANVALLEACFAVEHAAVVEALAHGNVEDELCALGSHSSKGCEPKNHHDAVEDDDGDYMIQMMQRWEPLGKNGIQCNDPSNERNSQGKAFFIKIGSVRQIGSQAKDDYRNENLKDTADKDPEGRDQDMVLFAFRLLHVEDELADDSN